MCASQKLRSFVWRGDATFMAETFARETFFLGGSPRDISTFCCHTVLTNTISGNSPLRRSCFVLVVPTGIFIFRNIHILAFICLALLYHYRLVNPVVSITTFGYLSAILDSAPHLTETTPPATPITRTTVELFFTCFPCPCTRCCSLTCGQNVCQF